MNKIKCFLLEDTKKTVTITHEFGSSDAPVYRRTDTGEERALREWQSVPGGMYFAPWMSDYKDWVGTDGRSLIVITPGGAWNVDSRASNCTLPSDTEHKCWVRHGEAPEITVDKNGKTCGAGAGSIAQKNYHGFLRNGYLEQC